MTQHFLHSREVSSRRDGEGGCCMAVAVIGEVLFYPCLHHPLPEYHFHSRRGDLQLVVNDDYTFHYYIISRRQFIDLLYESHQWYKYSWNREKDIKDSSPACLSTKWLSGVGEHETDKHESLLILYRVCQQKIVGIIYGKIDTKKKNRIILRRY